METHDQTEFELVEIKLFGQVVGYERVQKRKDAEDEQIVIVDTIQVKDNEETVTSSVLMDVQKDVRTCNIDKSVCKP
jgi:hypothetical protein